MAGSGRSFSVGIAAGASSHAECLDEGAGVSRCGPPCITRPLGWLPSVGRVSAAEGGSTSASSPVAERFGVGELPRTAPGEIGSCQPTAGSEFELRLASKGSAREPTGEEDRGRRRFPRS